MDTSVPASQTASTPEDLNTEFNRGMEFMENTMEDFLGAASVDAVYGKPVKSGDTIVIPTAEVISGLGYGVGFGSGGGPVGEDGKPQGSGAGGGGGGGGKVLSRPVAVVIISPEGVRVEPVVDATKIALAALTAWGFIFGMLARMRKGKIADED